MITLFTNFIEIKILPVIFLLLALIFHLLCVKIINTRKKKEFYYTLNNKDFLAFQKYFDKYYVTNIWYTSFMVLLYIVGIFGIFLFARVLFLGYSLHVILIDTNVLSWMNILFILFLILSFILLILFYKTFLDIMFFTECIKLYYYIKYNRIYYWLEEYFTLGHLNSFFVQLEITLEYVTTTESIFDNDTNYTYFSNANLVKNDFSIWNIIRRANQKYLLLWIIFKILHKISFNFRNHLYRIYLLPQTIVILIGCVEVFKGTIHYFYYGLPLLLIINILGQYYMFLIHKEIMLDGTIYRYFYDESNKYKKIRSYFIQNRDLITDEMLSTETHSLKNSYDYNELTTYIANNFKSERTQTMTEKHSRSKIHREQIIIILSFIIYNYASIYF